MITIPSIIQAAFESEPNTIESHLIHAAFETGATALAATSEWITLPVGSLEGAIFGATRYLTSIPLGILAKKWIEAHPQASAAAKAVIASIEFFGSFAAAWGALTLTGCSLTFSSVALLGGMSALYMAVGRILWGAIAMQYLCQKIISER
jgi:hypothetical protein